MIKGRDSFNMGLNPRRLPESPLSVRFPSNSSNSSNSSSASSSAPAPAPAASSVRLPESPLTSPVLSPVSNRMTLENTLKIGGSDVVLEEAGSSGSRLLLSAQMSDAISKFGDDNSNNNNNNL
jgi:hypothetical protein